MPAEAKLEIQLTRKPGDQTVRSSKADAGDSSAGSHDRTQFKEVLQELQKNQLELFKELASKKDTIGPALEELSSRFTDWMKQESDQNAKVVEALKQGTAAAQDHAKDNETKAVRYAGDQTVMMKDITGPLPNLPGDELARTQRMSIDDLRKLRPAKKTEQSDEIVPSDDIKKMLDGNRVMQIQLVQFMQGLASGKLGGIFGQAGGLITDYARRKEDQANDALAADGKPSATSSALLSLAGKAGLVGAAFTGVTAAAGLATAGIKKMADDSRMFSPSLIRNDAVFEQQELLRNQKNANVFGEDVAKSERLFNRIWRNIKGVWDNTVGGWSVLFGKIEDAIASREDTQKRDQLNLVLLLMAAEMKQQGKTNEEIAKRLKELKDAMERKEIEDKANMGLKMINDMMKEPAFDQEANRPPVDENRIWGERVAPEFGEMPQMNL